MLQRQFSHLNGRELDNRQVYASDIFYVWLRIILYRENVHSLDFVWLLLVVWTELLVLYIAQVWTAQKTSLSLLRVRSLPGKERVHRAVP
jgi:hypothetical protein